MLKTLFGRAYPVAPKENPFRDGGALRISRATTGRELNVGGGVKVHAAKKAAALPMELQRFIRPEAAMNWLSPMLRSITPTRIENILRGALGGDYSQQWELFDLMEDTWPTLAKNLNEVKRAVVKMDWRIQAWADEEEAPSETAEERAKFVSNAVWTMNPEPAHGDNGFEDTLYDILDGYFKGISVLELLWHHQNDGILPKSTAWVHPSNYAWGTYPDGERGLGLTLGTNSVFSSSVFRPSRELIIERFPEHKFLVAISRAKTGHPFAGALLRPLAWWWCAANFSSEWLLNFGQIFGLPIRWGTYDPAQPGLLERLSDMLENMGSTAWGAFPQGTTFELKEAGKSGGGSDTPQGNMLDRADRQCTLMILGQTLTSDVGDSGSRALGDVHQSVRGDILQAAADFAARVINGQFVPAILELNFGDREEAPEFCPEPRKTEDAKANAERDVALSKFVTMPEKWFRKRHNIPEPQAGEAVIGGPRKDDADDENGELENPTESLKATRHAQQGHGVELRARDRATTQLLESVSGVEARWLGGLRPYFRELIELAENAKDEADLTLKLQEAIDKSKRRFPELFDKMDVEFLADRLEGVMGAGCVNGAVAAAMRRRLPQAKGGG